MEIHTSIRLWAARLWGKILQPVQTWRAAPCCRCSSPKGCLEQHFGFLHNPIPQNTTPHMGAVCGSSPALSLLCFWHCLSALLRLISPFPHLIFFATVHMCCSVSSVLLCFFGMHGPFYSWCLHFKNARKSSSILEQKCPRHSLSLTSSFSFKGIVWINERLFIAGTKCSDMPEMSKRYYAPLKGPLFTDRNGNFMPL